MAAHVLSPQMKLIKRSHPQETGALRFQAKVRELLRTTAD